MSNAKIRQNVLNELAFEPSIDANHIGVAVENGVVTLTGYVPNFSQKSAVERAVLRIKGVKGIAEEIEVRFHQGAGSADDEIARRSIDMLKWSTLVPEGKVLAELKRRTRLAAHSKAVARSRLVLGGNGRLVFEKRHDAEVGSSISSILRMKGSPPFNRRCWLHQKALARAHRNNRIWL